MMVDNHAVDKAQTARLPWIDHVTIVPKFFLYSEWADFIVWMMDSKIDQILWAYKNENPNEVISMDHPSLGKLTDFLTQNYWRSV